MLGYLPADIICSEKRTIFRERSSRKTVSFEEQIMSKDKYPSTVFAPNGDYGVDYHATRAVLKIGVYLTIRPVARKGYGSFVHTRFQNVNMDRTMVMSQSWGRWCIHSTERVHQIRISLVTIKLSECEQPNRTHRKGWGAHYFEHRIICQFKGNINRLYDLSNQKFWCSQLT